MKLMPKNNPGWYSLRDMESVFKSHMSKILCSVCIINYVNDSTIAISHVSLASVSGSRMQGKT